LRQPKNQKRKNNKKEEFAKKEQTCSMCPWGK
jgi:hypothetical protein